MGGGEERFAGKESRVASVYFKTWTKMDNISSELWACSVENGGTSSATLSTNKSVS